MSTSLIRPRLTPAQQEVVAKVTRGSPHVWSACFLAATPELVAEVRRILEAHLVSFGEREGVVTVQVMDIYPTAVRGLLAHLPDGQLAAETLAFQGRFNGERLISDVYPLDDREFDQVADLLEAAGYDVDEELVPVYEPHQHGPGAAHHVGWPGLSSAVRNARRREQDQGAGPRSRLARKPRFAPN